MIEEGLGSGELTLTSHFHLHFEISSRPFAVTSLCFPQSPSILSHPRRYFVSSAAASYFPVAPRHRQRTLYSLFVDTIPPSANYNGTADAPRQRNRELADYDGGTKAAGERGPEPGGYARRDQEDVST